jgi:glycerol uptake facilitator protein
MEYTMSPYLAEFIGTAVLLYFGNSVNALTTLKYSFGHNSGWVITCIGWGLSVTFGVYAAGEISGAHINPAVTTSLAVAGEFEWAKVPGYIIAQVLGAIFGAALAWLQYLPHWRKTTDQGAKLGVFCTSGAIDQKSANLVSEMLGTMILVFGLLSLGANEFAKGLNPLAVGGLIVLIGMAQGGSTGYAINPARDFGPRLAHFLLPIAGKGSSNWSYSWVPIVGPLLGGAAGAAIYILAFRNEYTTMSIAAIITLALAIAIAVYDELSKKETVDENQVN